MNREEAIAKIQGLLDDPIVRGGVAFVDQPTLRSIQDALRTPVWIKTTERAPTAEDAGIDDCVFTVWLDDEGHLSTGADYWDYVKRVPERIPYWMPIPKLPEVENEL